MICNKCGNQIPEGQTVCNVCGQIQTNGVEIVNTPVESNIPNTPVVENKPKKNKILLISTIFVFILVICVFVLLKYIPKENEINIEKQFTTTIKNEVSSDKNKDEYSNKYMDIKEDSEYYTIYHFNFDDVFNGEYTYNIGDNKFVFYPNSDDMSFYSFNDSEKEETLYYAFNIYYFKKSKIVILDLDNILIGDSNGIRRLVNEINKEGYISEFTVNEDAFEFVYTPFYKEDEISCSSIEDLSDDDIAIATYGYDFTKGVYKSSDIVEISFNLAYILRDELQCNE